MFWLTQVFVCMYVYALLCVFLLGNAVMNVTAYGLLGSVYICDLLIVVLCNYLQLKIFLLIFLFLIVSPSAVPSEIVGQELR